jgi:hypothetical protein
VHLAPPAAVTTSAAAALLLLRAQTQFILHCADPKQVRGALPIERWREDAAFRAEWFWPALQIGQDTAWPVAPEALPAQVHSGGRSSLLVDVLFTGDLTD